MWTAVSLTCLLLLIQLTSQDIPDGVHCPKYPIEEPGTFFSPEFMQDENVIYGFHCWYDIRTGRNKKIVLEFLEFDLHEPMYTEKINHDKYEVGCEKEFIEVYRDAKKEEKERYCGSELTGRTITSTGNRMKFVLNKYYKESKGFKIKLRFVKNENLHIDGCKEMYSKAGDIVIPNAKADCRVTAKAPVGQAAKLTVTSITPAPTGTDCQGAKLAKKSPAKANKGHFPVCGADILKTSFKGLGNVLDLRVQAPGKEVKAKITFNEEPKTCGGEIHMEAGSTKKIRMPNHIRTPIHNALSCVWTVIIPNDAKGLKIDYTAFDLAPKKSYGGQNLCIADQFAAIEFKESDIGKFVERQAKEDYQPGCATDYFKKTQEFTTGKTVYLFLNLDMSVNYERHLEADLSLL